MNERIKDLFEQACFETEYDDVQNLKEMSQRFAELIILECAEMFEGVYTDQHRPERIDTRIKQHFGV